MAYEVVASTADVQPRLRRFVSALGLAMLQSSTEEPDATTPLVMWGTGVPAEVVPNGSFALRLDAADAGTALYVRIGGAWVAVSASAADVATALAHVTADGSSHGFIDQDVTSGAAPVLSAANMTGLPSSGPPSDVWDFSADSATKATIQADLGVVLDDSDSALSLADITSGVMNMAAAAVDCRIHATESNSPPYFYKTYAQVPGEAIEVIQRLKLNQLTNYNTAHMLLAPPSDDPWLSTHWIAAGLGHNFSGEAKAIYVRRGDSVDFKDSPLASVTAYNWVRTLIDPGLERARVFYDTGVSQPTVWTPIVDVKTSLDVSAQLLPYATFRCGPGLSTWEASGTLIASWDYFEVRGANVVP